MPFARPVLGSLDVVNVKPTVSNLIFVDAAGAVNSTLSNSDKELYSTENDSALTYFTSIVIIISNNNMKVIFFNLINFSPYSISILL